MAAACYCIMAKVIAVTSPRSQDCNSRDAIAGSGGLPAVRVAPGRAVVRLCAPAGAHGNKTLGRGTQAEATVTTRSLPKTLVRSGCADGLLAVRSQRKQ